MKGHNNLSMLICCNIEACLLHNLKPGGESRSTQNISIYVSILYCEKIFRKISICNSFCLYLQTIPIPVTCKVTENNQAFQTFVLFRFILSINLLPKSSKSEYV